MGGALDLDALEEQSAEEAILSLCQIKGIGPWTAEVYLLFAAGHPDIFPAADVALRGVRADRLRARCATGGARFPSDVRCLVALAQRRGASPLGLLPRKEGRENGYAGIGLRFLSGSSCAALAFSLKGDFNSGLRSAALYIGGIPAANR